MLPWCDFAIMISLKLQTEKTNLKMGKFYDGYFFSIWISLSWLSSLLLQISAILYLESVTLKILYSYRYIKWGSSISTFLKLEYFQRTCFISLLIIFRWVEHNKQRVWFRSDSPIQINNRFPGISGTNECEKNWWRNHGSHLHAFPTTVCSYFVWHEKEQELIIAFISDFIVSVQSVAISAHSFLLIISIL